MASFADAPCRWCLSSSDGRQQVWTHLRDGPLHCPTGWPTFTERTAILARVAATAMVRRKEPELAVRSRPPPSTWVGLTWIPLDLRFLGIAGGVLGTLGPSALGPPLFEVDLVSSGGRPEVRMDGWEFAPKLARRSRIWTKMGAPPPPPTGARDVVKEDRCGATAPRVFGEKRYVPQGSSPSKPDFGPPPSDFPTDCLRAPTRADPHIVPSSVRPPPAQLTHEVATACGDGAASAVGAHAAGLLTTSALGRSALAVLALGFASGGVEVHCVPLDRLRGRGEGSHTQKWGA